MRKNNIVIYNYLTFFNFFEYDITLRNL